ncbi:MAG: hypothetical protein FWG85_01585 [Bacteroidetes bacterium]|nr:hypothetical protein [Bacteroidota bacterium]
MIHICRISLLCLLFVVLNSESILCYNVDDTSKSLSSSDNNQQYAPEQDSNFFRDSKLNFGFLYWLKKSILTTDYEWQIYKKEFLNTPSNNLQESFARMPSNIFAPDPVEIVQRQIAKQDALSIPTIRFYKGGTGINLDMRDIGLFLGLVEDTSPKITYTLKYNCDIEIVIYSISAKIIATIFSGTQKPGNYTTYWNGKDEYGKQVPPGDYIAEVRIGSERFIMKRIVIGGY